MYTDWVCGQTARIPSFLDRVMDNLMGNMMDNIWRMFGNLGSDE